ncbi:MAG: hypothetical protein NC254_13100 [bacterium]|nr:hypothetical protein [bacterium]
MTTARTERFREQAVRMLQNIHDNQFHREVLLTGLVESEQKAYEDLTAHSDDYNQLMEKETRLEQELDARLGSCDPLLCEYMETVNDTTAIYGDEMYLRGIQDAAILLTGMISARNVRDITGGTFRKITYDSAGDTPQAAGGADMEALELRELPYNARRIAEHIGKENLIWISETFGGQYLYIHKKDALMRYLNKAAIRQDRKNGMTYEALAEKYNISVDSVRRTVRKP